jgi:transportin-3
MVLMASNGSGPTGAFEPVLNAMSTMRDGQREQKKAAHQYLESFQKSVGPGNAVSHWWWWYHEAHRLQSEAWQITIGILGSQADAEAKLFAATTLRGKVDISGSWGGTIS